MPIDRRAFLKLSGLATMSGAVPGLLQANDVAAKSPSVHVVMPTTRCASAAAWWNWHPTTSFSPAPTTVSFQDRCCD